MTWTPSSTTPKSGTKPFRCSSVRTSNSPSTTCSPKNDDAFYTAYASEQNLELDDDDTPINHPDIDKYFSGFRNGSYQLKDSIRN